MAHQVCLPVPNNAVIDTFSQGVAAADERVSTVGNASEEGGPGSWAPLAHAAKPLVALLAATTGIALLVQLLFRCAHQSTSHCQAHAICVTLPCLGNQTLPPYC